MPRTPLGSGSYRDAKTYVRLTCKVTYSIGLPFQLTKLMMNAMQGGLDQWAEETEAWVKANHTWNTDTGSLETSITGYTPGYNDDYQKHWREEPWAAWQAYDSNYAIWTEELPGVGWGAGDTQSVMGFVDEENLGAISGPPYAVVTDFVFYGIQAGPKGGPEKGRETMLEALDATGPRLEGYVGDALHGIFG